MIQIWGILARAVLPLISLATLFIHILFTVSKLKRLMATVWSQCTIFLVVLRGKLSEAISTKQGKISENVYTDQKRAAWH